MIKVRTKLSGWVWVDPIDSPLFAAAMRERGIEFGTDDPSPDLDFIDARFFAAGECPLPGENHKLGTTPTILFDGRDYAATSPLVRQLSTDDRVKAIVKPLAYVEGKWENFKHYENTIFGATMLAEAEYHERPANDATAPAVEMPAEGFAKVVQMNHSIFATHWDRCNLPTPEDFNRPIDVLFIGCARHYWQWSSRLHRKLALDAVRSLPDDVVHCSAIAGREDVPDGVDGCRMTRFGHLPHRWDHFHLIQLSKIVVSPFGFSEISTREAEATLAGCCVIKPQCDYLDYKPTLFTDSTFFDDWRFSNLTPIVEHILSEYRGPNGYHSKAKQLAESLNDLRDRRWEVLAEFYSKLIRKALS